MRIPVESRVISWVFFAAFCLWLSFLLTSCTTIPNTHQPFYKQIVRMRAGHTGLTHQVCGEKDWKGTCTRWDLIEYDLGNAAVRKQFYDFQFICKLGGSRWKVDPDQPRLVRYKTYRPCWLCKEETVVEKWIPVSNTAMLLNGGMYCYSEKNYPEGITQ